MPHTEEPMETMLRQGRLARARGRLADYCKWLEKTGRAWAIPELRRRHPGEFTSDTGT